MCTMKNPDLKYIYKKRLKKKKKKKKSSYYSEDSYLKF
jgi:hypothetical protein